jgi:hypothetical protein
MKNKLDLVVVVAIATAFVTVVAQAQHYTNGQVGVFGNGEKWNYGTPAALGNSTARGFSARFTAMENVTVDRVYQRLTTTQAGSLFRIGIQADDGFGNPTGVYLQSAVVDPTDGNAVEALVFGSISLTAGNVYHLVTKLDTATGPGGFSNDIRMSSENHDIRPYDRAYDPKMTVLFTNDGVTWSDLNKDPYFIFANGANTAFVAGPGQPYSDHTSNLNPIQGGGGNKRGQVFTITDKEIPAGKWVATHKLKLTPTANPTAIANNQPLIVRIRDSNNNILGSTTILPSQANGTEQEFRLDQQIELQQGLTYVMTTEFGTFGTTSEFYFLAQNAGLGINFSGNGEMAAGWGGMAISYPVRNASNGGNVWVTGDFVPLNDGFHDRSDIRFSFTGVVVPEPTAGLLTLFSALLLWRRRI